MTAERPLSTLTIDPISRESVIQRRARRRTRRGLGVFLATFAVVFVAVGTWSLATPLFAAPDEPVHIIKAAAVVRGELLGALQGPATNPLGVVTVPAFYAGTRNLPLCFHRHPTVPASCAPAPTGGTTATKVYVYNARYPPLYYAIVGLPSLLGASRLEIYLMRLVSAALSALFIALAVMTVAKWSRSRFALLGVIVATTPMVLFLGGVVNPAGLEASAGVAVWTAGAVLVVEHLDQPPPGLVGVLAFSSAVLELVRPLSPFWLGCTAIVLLGVANLRALRSLFSRRYVQLALFGVVVVGALAMGWILAEHAYDVYSTTPVGSSVPESTILETSFLHNDFYLPGMIGVFGWFDTYAPTYTFVVWYGLVGLVVLAAAVVGRWRDALVLALFVVAIVVIPVAISSSQVHRDGFTWAGKDTLVFAVGLPIVASTILGESVLATYRARAVGLAGLLAFSAQVAAFFEMLRRYAVGTAGADFGFLAHAAWHAPIAFGVLLGVEAGALAVLAVLAYRLAADGGPVTGYMMLPYLPTAAGDDGGPGARRARVGNRSLYDGQADAEPRPAPSGSSTSDGAERDPLA